MSIGGPWSLRRAEVARYAHSGPLARRDCLRDRRGDGDEVAGGVEPLRRRPAELVDCDQARVGSRQPQVNERRIPWRRRSRDEQDVTLHRGAVGQYDGVQLPVAGVDSRYLVEDLYVPRE